MPDANLTWNATAPSASPVPDFVPVPPEPQLRRWRSSPRFGAAMLALLGLVIAADVLLYQREVGINLLVLFTAIALASMALRMPRVAPRHLFLGFGVYGLAALPLIEAADWLPFVCGVTGLAILALTAGGFLPAGISRLGLVLWRFFVLVPVRLIGDLTVAAQQRSGRKSGGAVFRHLAIWVVPVVCTGIFMLLFADANPVLGSLVSAINVDFLFNGIEPFRAVWWLLMAMAIFPFLAPRLLPWRKARPVAARAPQPESLLFGSAAILRSLIAFNALFALQTALDIYYLWTGHALPDGMTYADYAHRGAYPLIVTAILAAIFVLAAMRKDGPGEGSRLIRGLVYLFIAQNIMLVLSSLLRLDLYVESYSLTRLRLAAAIWMVLVAIGLALILLRILLNRSNRWLIGANLISLASVLYLTAFVDFSAIIARYNVEHSAELSGQGVALDVTYLAQLGPSAFPAMQFFLDSRPGRSEVIDIKVRDALDFGLAVFNPIKDWRSWTLRKQRQSDFVLGGEAGSLVPDMAHSTNVPAREQD